MSTADGLNFFSNIDDTVRYSNSKLSISKYEYNSTTSKETLKLKRIMLFEIYDDSGSAKSVKKKNSFMQNFIIMLKEWFDKNKK